MQQDNLPIPMTQRDLASMQPDEQRDYWIAVSRVWTRNQEEAMGQSAPATPPDADRTTRFLDRLDVHLANLKTRGLRMAFLSGQAARWEREYQQFVAMVMDGSAELSPNSPTATDYVMTIAAVYARLKIEEDMQ